MYLCADDLLVNLVALTPKAARRQFRKHIFEEWGWKCAYCDRELTEDTATIDHVLPKHKGGQNVKNNLLCSCSSCNKDKSTKEWKSWYQLQSCFCKKREEKIENWIKQIDPNILSLSSLNLRSL